MPATQIPARAGKLQGKVAVVTGGGSGIGLATARLYRAEGATVVITASTAGSFAKAKTELGKEFDVFQVDVADVAQIEALFAYVKSKYGFVDVVFANAGIAQFKPTLEFEVELYDRIMDVNVRGVYYTVARALPLFRDGGVVVINSSMASVMGIPGASVYAATKATIRSFVRTWTAEIPPAKVRFNVLSPGPTVTPIFGKLGPDSSGHTPEIEAFAQMVPMKRAADVEEIARAALFLSCADSSYVAGADLFASGGGGQV